MDVLALLEKQEKEEEARMDLLENMILKGKSASAADKEAWRRWARAGGTKRKMEEEEEKEASSLSSSTGVSCSSSSSKFEIMGAPQFQFIDRVCWLFQW